MQNFAVGRQVVDGFISDYSFKVSIGDNIPRVSYLVNMITDEDEKQRWPTMTIRRGHLVFIWQDYAL